VGVTLSQKEKIVMSSTANVGRALFLLLLTAIAPPAVAQTTADQDPVTVEQDGFDDWGLLGLLGLAGLLGRKRREPTVADSRRV
jgi:MYXO-CTERM domain-containing protein